jgi:hypothetical protein
MAIAEFATTLQVLDDLVTVERDVECDVAQFSESGVKDHRFLDAGFADKDESAFAHLEQ